MAPVGASALRNLAKNVGLVGGLEPRLGGVGAVVEPDADDLVGIGDRRQQRDLVERGVPPAARPIDRFLEPAGAISSRTEEPGVEHGAVARSRPPAARDPIRS